MFSAAWVRRQDKITCLSMMAANRVIQTTVVILPS
jgi:hypothetical protein